MRVAILGFGIEGKDAAKYFVQKKDEVSVFDIKTLEELGIENEKSEQGLALFKNVHWICGKDYLKNGIEGFNTIVRSPGIRPDLPEILEAVKNGTKLTSTTKIFFDEAKKPIIGVTGTKGKGTTSSLIAEGLKACGKKVVLLGNIGEPTLSSLDRANQSDYVVLELSSFQTIDLHKSPHVVVVTNITPDHMDWHTDLQEYERAKTQLWANQTKEDFLVLNEDDIESVRLAVGAPGIVQKYNGENPNASELSILGKHNVYNANAAMLTIKLLGENEKLAWKGMTSFKGLEHRLEVVATINRVLYINDSYATNPEPTLAAIRSFQEPKILILGGSSKEADFSNMAQEIVKQNVRGVVLVGDEAEKIKNSLERVGFKGEMWDGGRSMTDFVLTAKSMAKPGDVVLLSPACASFGLFENYKDRGKQFKEAVKNL